MYISKDYCVIFYDFLRLDKNTKRKLLVARTKKEYETLRKIKEYYFFCEKVILIEYVEGHEEKANIEYLLIDKENLNEKIIKRCQEKSLSFIDIIKNSKDCFNDFDKYNKAKYIKLYVDFLKLNEDLKIALRFKTFEEIDEYEVNVEKKYIFKNHVITVNTTNNKYMRENFDADLLHDIYIDEEDEEYEKFNYIEKNYQKIITQSKIEQF